jgi:hypothetical protein
MITEEQMAKLSVSNFNAPREIRLLIISEKQTVRLFEGERFFELTTDIHGHIKSLTKDRGKILEVFSRIEFLINELIKFDILGIPDRNTDWKKRNVFEDEILMKIDLKDKIKILKSRGYFDNTLSSKLFDLKEVRNKYAHSWIESRIMYHNKPIESYTNSSFHEFMTDMIEVWEKLFEIYKKEQNKINIEDLIQFL